MRGCSLPRKTDSSNPADWIWLAEEEIEGVRVLAEREVSYSMCRSKLAEILEKVLKAELIRLGWFLEKTHDLQKLASELRYRSSELFPRLKPLVTTLAEVYFAARYPGFDLEDPDWPDLRAELAEVTWLLETVKGRIRGA
jgi:HEPN domain-containing protein